MNERKSLLLTALVAGLVAGGQARAMPQDKPEKGDPKEIVRCYGINECAGKTACDTAVNSCAGANKCKGKGFIEITRKACKAKRGKFKDPNVKAEEPKKN